MVIFKTSNELIADLLLMYCEGKGVLWNIYFGWRKSEFKSDGSVVYVFKIPRHLYQRAEKIAEKYGYEILA